MKVRHLPVRKTLELWGGVLVVSQFLYQSSADSNLAIGNKSLFDSKYNLKVFIQLSLLLYGPVFSPHLHLTMIWCHYLCPAVHALHPRPRQSLSLIRVGIVREKLGIGLIAGLYSLFALDFGRARWVGSECSSGLFGRILFAVWIGLKLEFGSWIVGIFGEKPWWSRDAKQSQSSGLPWTSLIKSIFKCSHGQDFVKAWFKNTYKNHFVASLYT